MTRRGGQQGGQRREQTVRKACWPLELTAVWGVPGGAVTSEPAKSAFSGQSVLATYNCSTPHVQAR